MKNETLELAKALIRRKSITPADEVRRDVPAIAVVGRVLREVLLYRLQPVS